MIHARALSRTFVDGEGAEARVLDGVELEVKAGEFVAVTGRSGSGKSTLMHVLGGLDSAFSGEVRVAGLTLSGLDDGALSRFRNTSVGFVFQSFHLVAGLSALENVALPALFGEAVENEKARALESLRRVGMEQKAARNPSALSGGESQRVAIARALYSAPKLLLCDEPTGNLDSATGEEVIAVFKQLNAEGLTILAVTHEERLSAVASRVLRLERGKLS